MWKDIRVNTKTGEIKTADMKPEYKMLGGRSLIAQFMIDEVNPKCDPLGEENKLIMCTTILAGTTGATAHRMSVGGKSPLTGGIKESNVGGTAAHYLAGHGIKMVVFEGKPSNNEWKILFIDKDSNISLIPAGDWMGLNNYAIVDKAKEKYGKDVSVVSIGKAGEMLYKNCAVMVTEFGSLHPCRAAARGGLGALMGSKGIKALVMEKPATRYKMEMADPDAFAAASKEYTQFLSVVAENQPFHKVGTIASVAGTSASGVLPVRNFTAEYFKEHEGIGPTTFMKNLAARGGNNGVACQSGCPVRCSNNYHDKDGKFLTAGFEYETVGLCGSNLNISDLDVVAKIDRFCDDFGLDTIETGATLGVCMDTGKIPWGDADAVFGLLDEMEKGTEFGKIMGQGTDYCGKYLGSKRIPTVKHQAMAAYDPRNLQGTGVTYAMTPMGADHTAGCTVSAGDGTSTNMQMYLSRTYQVLNAASDSYMCMFGFLFGASRMDLIAKMTASIYGIPFAPPDILAAGVKCLMTERAFNKAAGFTVEDDAIPEFMHTEKSPLTGSSFSFSAEEMQTVFDFV